MLDGSVGENDAKGLDHVGIVALVESLSVCAGDDGPGESLDTDDAGAGGHHVSVFGETGDDVVNGSGRAEGRSVAYGVDGLESSELVLEGDDGDILFGDGSHGPRSLRRWACGRGSPLEVSFDGGGGGGPYAADGLIGEGGADDPDFVCLLDDMGEFFLRCGVDYLSLIGDVLQAAPVIEDAVGVFCVGRPVVHGEIRLAGEGCGCICPLLDLIIKHFSGPNRVGALWRTLFVLGCFGELNIYQSETRDLMIPQRPLPYLP